MIFIKRYDVLKFKLTFAVLIINALPGRTINDLQVVDLPFSTIVVLVSGICAIVTLNSLNGSDEEAHH